MLRFLCLVGTSSASLLNLDVPQSDLMASSSTPSIDFNGTAVWSSISPLDDSVQTDAYGILSGLYNMVGTAPDGMPVWEQSPLPLAAPLLPEPSHERGLKRPRRGGGLHHRSCSGGECAAVGADENGLAHNPLSPPSSRPRRSPEARPLQEHTSEGEPSNLLDLFGDDDEAMPPATDSATLPADDQPSASELRPPTVTPPTVPPPTVPPPTEPTSMDAQCAPQPPKPPPTPPTSPPAETSGCEDSGSTSAQHACVGLPFGCACAERAVSGDPLTCGECIEDTRTAGIDGASSCTECTPWIAIEAEQRYLAVEEPRPSRLEWLIAQLEASAHVAISPTSKRGNRPIKFTRDAHFTDYLTTHKNATFEQLESWLLSDYMCASPPLLTPHAHRNHRALDAASTFSDTASPSALYTQVACAQASQAAL